MMTTTDKKITVDPRTGMVYVKLKGGTIAKTKEVMKDTIFIDVDRRGDLIGVEIFDLYHRPTQGEEGKMQFISKSGEWFDEGTEAKLIFRGDPYSGNKDINADFGLFRGVRHGHPDEEMCCFDEFEIVEEN